MLMGEIYKTFNNDLNMEIKLFYGLEKCILSLVDKTDTCQKFAASIKAAYFQQDWTCCIPFTI
jgi:hypothetical protein